MNVRTQTSLKTFATLVFAATFACAGASHAAKCAGTNINYDVHLEETEIGKGNKLITWRGVSVTVADDKSAPYHLGASGQVAVARDTAPRDLVSCDDAAPALNLRMQPIIRPGRFLSQAPMPKIPSHWWPRTVASTLSAISSREISEKRMPECAIDSPSERRRPIPPGIRADSTHCRTGSAGKTWSARWAAACAMCRALQEGPSRCV